MSMSFLKTQLKSIDDNDIQVMIRIKDLIVELIEYGSNSDNNRKFGEALSDCFCKAVKHRKFRLANMLIIQAEVVKFYGMDNEKIQKSMLSIREYDEKVENDDYYVELTNTVKRFVNSC